MGRSRQAELQCSGFPGGAWTRKRDPFIFHAAWISKTASDSIKSAHRIDDRSGRSRSRRCHPGWCRQQPGSSVGPQLPLPDFGFHRVAAHRRGSVFPLELLRAIVQSYRAGFPTSERLAARGCFEHGPDRAAAGTQTVRRLAIGVRGSSPEFGPALDACGLPLRPFRS